MKKLTLFVSAVLFCSISSFSLDEGKGGNTEDTPQKHANNARKAEPFNKTISIYRYGDFPISKAQKLEKQLKVYYPQVKLKKEVLALPTKHYNKERNRYRGTGLIEEMSKHRNGDALIGLTNNMIFQPNELSSTYGIMGTSILGEYKCIVSSRLPTSGKEQTEENLIKLALHELGHAFGLNHCPNQHCYMVDAEHKMKFPQTTGFCESCKSKLNANGWTIK